MEPTDCYRSPYPVSRCTQLGLVEPTDCYRSPYPVSRCTQLGLVERCERVPARLATEEELQLCHSPEHIRRLRQLCERADPQQLRQEADKHDSVYLHPVSGAMAPPIGSFRSRSRFSLTRVDADAGLDFPCVIWAMRSSRCYV